MDQRHQLGADLQGPRLRGRRALALEEPHPQSTSQRPSKVEAAPSLRQVANCPCLGSRHSCSNNSSTRPRTGTVLVAHQLTASNHQGHKARDTPIIRQLSLPSSSRTPHRQQAARASILPSNYPIKSRPPARSRSREGARKAPNQAGAAAAKEHRTTGMNDGDKID